jgi:hypothetical protein
VAQLTMVFWRDADKEPACLEYSWVPEGKRHVIRLTPGLQEDSRTDPIPMDEISHVQVYRLTSDAVGIDSWQFPPGPPHSAPVIYAAVEVFEKRMEVVGTVHYSDGSSASDRRLLHLHPLRCPETPSDDAR